MLIYIAHIYQGDERNKQRIESIIKMLSIKHPNNTYISPVHTFGFMYGTVPYEQGLKMCLNLLTVCDRMEVYGDYHKSRGVNAEIKYCQDHKIPYRIILDTDPPIGKMEV